MKFQLISDLHLEKYDKLPNMDKLIIPKAKNLILAGDICFAKHDNFLPFFKKISQLFDKIFYVFGNHEYYTHNFNCYSIDEVEIYIKEKLEGIENIIILQKDFKELEDDIIIIGATLWSYLSRKDIFAPIKYLSETNFISVENKIMLHPNITNKVHLEHKKWIEYMLSCFESKKIIVVTHYLPSKRCINKKYKYDAFSKSFYSNCDHLVQKANVWCAGHTHTPMVRHIKGVPIYINPCGYLWEHNTFDKEFVFEV